MKNLNKIRGKREFHFDDKELMALGISSLLLVVSIFWLGLLIGKGGQAQEIARVEETPSLTLSSSDTPPASQPQYESPASVKPKEEDSPRSAAISQPSESKGEVKLSYYKVLQDADHSKDQETKQPEANTDASPAKSDHSGHKESRPGPTLETAVSGEPSKESRNVATEPPGPGRSDALPEVPSRKPEGFLRVEPDLAVYSIQVASSQNRDESELLREHLREKGYDASLISVNLGPQGIWYRVRVGSVRDRIEAERLKKELQEKFSNVAKNPLIVKESEP
jgi:cell division protein FtsN